MAARDFRPTGFAISRDTHMDMIENRLRIAGEYVYHAPIGGDKQAVVVNYQYAPDKNDEMPFRAASTVPRVFGLIDHFDTRPSVYAAASSARAARGSQFEIRGYMYNVTNVAVDHRGSLTIELVQDDKCTAKRVEFDTEMEALLCLPVKECVDI